MKSKIFVILVIYSLFNCSFLAAMASYYYDDGKNENNPYVDKFKPTSGVKIKESNVANWMENTTRKAMDENKTNKRNKTNYNKAKPKNVNSNGTYTKSYKWF